WCLHDDDDAVATPNRHFGSLCLSTDSIQSASRAKEIFDGQLRYVILSLRYSKLFFFSGCISIQSDMAFQVLMLLDLLQQIPDVSTDLDRIE
uniref:Uncharacterized protein n=1 Tax=Oryza brachyantha TaxID=4533 RepID=J3LDU3_ORYBR